MDMLARFLVRLLIAAGDDTTHVHCCVLPFLAAGVPQVMGGECNYLHKLAVIDNRVRLVQVDPELWKDGRGVRWDHAGITKLLDTAEVRA